MAYSETQNISSETDQPRRISFIVVALGLVLFLLIAYVLAPIPLRLMRGNLPFSPLLERIFWPLDWCYWHVPAIRWFYDTVFQFFGV